MTATSGSTLYRLGGLQLQVVSDGTLWIDGGAVFGLVPKPLWQRMAAEVNEQNEVPLGLNCLLVRSNGQTILIDSGLGLKLDDRRKTFYHGDYGHLIRNLAKNGVRPPDIDIVINTHLHVDHCGWNTAMVHGRPVPTFPRARYYVQRGEYEIALHPNERTSAAYMTENVTPLLESGQLELIEGEYQITPEIRFLPAPGHTAAHACVAIVSGGERALYCGDLVHHTAQLERAAWIPAVDNFPLMSLETKKRLVEEMLRENALVIITHAPFPGAGRLTRADNRTKWISA